MMNREILFRGKRKDDGKWIEGSLITYPSGNMRIAVTTSSHESQVLYGLLEFIIPETVGQYTGATDKTGKKMFEGDIVKLQSNHTSYYIVELYKYQWIFRYINRKTEYYQFDTVDDNFGMKNGISENVEIIGNIHDDPDLLEQR